MMMSDAPSQLLACLLLLGAVGQLPVMLGKESMVVLSVAALNRRCIERRATGTESAKWSHSSPVVGDFALATTAADHSRQTRSLCVCRIEKRLLCLCVRVFVLCAVSLAPHR